LDIEAIQADLDRRKPGNSSLTSARAEADTIEILSGVFDGKTLGTAIGFLFRNRDANPSAYRPFKDKYRPSHADYTYDARYGIRDWRGGGRASARETVCRVAAGGIARQILAHQCNAEIIAWVDQVGHIESDCNTDRVTRAQVDATEVRCPDPDAAARMAAEIKDARSNKDTIGGVLRCVVRNVPAGLGDPVFDKLEADLAHACMSIPAAKGFSIGSGFAGSRMRGSEHNDAFAAVNGQVATTTNHSGGIQGGISNGMNILLSVAFKPVATIFTTQDTVTTTGKSTTIAPRGRHDPCVLPRAVPIVEAMVALVLCDHLLRWRAIQPLPATSNVIKTEK